MKTIFIFIIALLGIAMMGSCSNQKSNRDLSYEHYCDSIWEADPDYYIDVLEETDEYQEYIKDNGIWW